MNKKNYKIRRNLSTESGRKFWAGVDKAHEEVMKWPKWKRDAAKASIRLEPSEPPDGDYSFW